MDDNQLYIETTTALETTRQKAQNFLFRVENCMNTGRTLISDGTAIIEAWRELQAVRQENKWRQEQFLKRMDAGLAKFREYLPILKENLKEQRAHISTIRNQLLSRNLTSLSPEELHAQNTLLKLLELEHRAYFAELDRILAL